MISVFVAMLVIVVLVGYDYPGTLTAYEETMDWTMFRSDECKMNMSYPISFKTEEITNEFENNADFTIHSDEPYVLVSVECQNLDINITKDNRTNDIKQVQEKLMGYDDFIVEDINQTK
jgi:hypothetical protein